MSKTEEIKKLTSALISLNATIRALEVFGKASAPDRIRINLIKEKDKILKECERIYQSKI